MIIKDIVWIETSKTFYCNSSLGNIILNKSENIAYIYGVTGVKKWYATISKYYNTPELKQKELMERLNNYHKTYIKSLMESWILN